MSEFSQYLPFSQRPRRDESAVTSNWAKHTGNVLLELADVLSELEPAEWEAPTLRPEVSVRQVVAQLGYRLGSTKRERAASAVRGFFREGKSPQAIAAANVLAAADASTGDLVRRVRHIATLSLASLASRTLSELSMAVVTAFEVAAATRKLVEVDAVASGAVALARSLNAPLSIRAVVRERSLVATDAGWSLGEGSKIEATAAVLVLFLFGRHGFPTAAG